MTVTFNSKVVEKHKKISNKKVLTGRLFRKKIKKSKKLTRSGKHFVCVHTELLILTRSKNKQ